MVKKLLTSILLAVMALAPAAYASTVNSAVNLSITNNSDGWQASGGTTARLFSITGAAWSLTATTFVVGSNTFTLPGASATLAGLGTAQTWSALQKFTNADFSLLGSSTGYTLLESGLSSTSNNTLTLPTESADTLVDLTGTQTLTNKTFTSTTNTLGGVTMGLGSDATGDTYYRNSSGYLTRLAAGSNGNVLTLASGIPSWAAPGGGYTPIPITVDTSGTVSAAINNLYVTNASGLDTVTLPSTAVIGSVVQVAGLGSGGWKIAQNASQLIHFGSTASTTGTSGYLSSNNQYDNVTLVCVVANTTWLVIASQGNITVN